MNPGALGRAGRFLALGFEFSGAVVGGLVVGYYADDYLGTSPWLLLLLSLVALGGAVYRLIWTLNRMERRP